MLSAQSEAQTPPLVTRASASADTALGWLNALPDALVQTRPFLCVFHAGLLTLANQLEAAAARLQDAERCIQAEMPDEQARTILGYVLTVRGTIAAYAGDIPHAVALSRQVLELLPETEAIPRLVATLAVAFAYQEHGDVTLATEREVAAAHAFICTFDSPFASMSSMALLAPVLLQNR